MTIQERVDHCLARECTERLAYKSAKCEQAKDAHFDLAERYADLAWSIKEGYSSADDFSLHPLG